MARLRTILRFRYVANEEARKNQQFDGWPSEAYGIGTILIKNCPQFNGSQYSFSCVILTV